MTPNQFIYHAWLAHRTLPHGQRPTERHMRIARLLGRWQHPCPSHRKLARAAKCCVRTVQNALGRFRRLGMLDWHAQTARMRSGQTLRLANRYRFLATFLLAAPKEERVKRINPISPLGKLSPSELEALRIKWGLV